MNFASAMNRLTVGQAALLGLCLAAFYYFIAFDSGVVPKQSIANSQTRIAELEKEIQESKAKLDRAAVYKKTAAEVGGTINKLVSLVPEKFTAADFMRIVSNEAKVAGSSLATVHPEGTAVWSVAKEFEEITVTVELVGTFLQHMVFLSNLTKLNQVLILHKYDLSVAKEAKSDEPSQLKLVAEIIGYRYRGVVTEAKTGGTAQ